jgi:hypothetical protein
VGRKCDFNEGKQKMRLEILVGHLLRDVRLGEK